MSSRVTPDSFGCRGAPRRKPGSIARCFWLSVAVALLTLAPPRAQAQSTGNDMEFRLGVTAFGIGLVGLSFEFRWGDRSLDTNLATFGFEDISVAVTGKQYFGGGDLQPFLGIGLWSVTAFAEDATKRTGQALLLRIPFGANWQVAKSHAFGGSLALNEGLWIRRSDPIDNTPIRHRPIPLPGFYYRAKP